jgi:hypothetical protein
MWRVELRGRGRTVLHVAFPMLQFTATPISCGRDPVSSFQDGVHQRSGSVVQEGLGLVPVSCPPSKILDCYVAHDHVRTMMGIGRRRCPMGLMRERCERVGHPNN